MCVPFSASGCYMPLHRSQFQYSGWLQWPAYKISRRWLNFKTILFSHFQNAELCHHELAEVLKDSCIHQVHIWFIVPACKTHPPASHCIRLCLFPLNKHAREIIPPVWVLLDPCLHCIPLDYNLPVCRLNIALFQSVCLHWHQNE